MGDYDNKKTFAATDDSVVVIIGSGAGGGTLANELAQKGVDVMLLEAGDLHEPGDFIADEWPSFQQLASASPCRTWSRPWRGSTATASTT